MRASVDPIHSLIHTAVALYALEMEEAGAWRILANIDNLEDHAFEVRQIRNLANRVIRIRGR